MHPPREGATSAASLDLSALSYPYCPPLLRGGFSGAVLHRVLPCLSANPQAPLWSFLLISLRLRSASPRPGVRGNDGGGSNVLFI